MMGTNTSKSILNEPPIYGASRLRYIIPKAVPAGGSESGSLLCMVER
jgi:hypothetical protein